MIRKAFGRDEVAEDDRCIFEIDIGFPSRVVKEDSLSILTRNFIIIGIR